MCRRIRCRFEGRRAEEVCRFQLGAVSCVFLRVRKKFLRVTIYRVPISTLSKGNRESPCLFKILEVLLTAVIASSTIPAVDRRGTREKQNVGNKRATAKKVDDMM